MNEHVLKLMRESAAARWQDAQTLVQVDPLGDRSDSEVLLSLLAFELLLKCLLHINGIKPSGQGHKYRKLFQQLPWANQSEILDFAIARIGPDSKLSYDYRIVLETLGENFIRLRYPYEAYMHVTEGEYYEMGEDWLSRGAPDEGANRVLYSNELFGLTEALFAATASVI